MENLLIQEELVLKGDWLEVPSGGPENLKEDQVTGTKERFFKGRRKATRANQRETNRGRSLWKTSFQGKNSLVHSFTKFRIKKLWTQLFLVLPRPLFGPSQLGFLQTFWSFLNPTKGNLLFFTQLGTKWLPSLEKLYLFTWHSLDGTTIVKTFPWAEKLGLSVELVWPTFTTKDSFNLDGREQLLLLPHGFLGSPEVIPKNFLPMWETPQGSSRVGALF